MKRTILALGSVLLVFYLITLFLTSTEVRQMSPQNQAGGKAFDLSVPRVPTELLAEAKALHNPVKPTPENLAKGKQIFTSTGACYTCHGVEGKGDGPSGVGLVPPPRNFTDPRFHGLRTDGELYWVVTHGSPGTSMFAYAPQVISNEDAWYVVTYVQTLSTPGSPDSAGNQMTGSSPTAASQ
ncbi:MAG TPA: c-type cytochrome [Nitrospiria bacterium]|nr:c-type cytochrome [Nitrospiria bacterium]